MIDQRRFHRVTCHAPGELIHHEMHYKCRLENVSLRGALISADECIMVPLGESCGFSFHPGEDARPIHVTVTVVHCFFSMVGVKFTAFAEDAEERLLELMKKSTPQPVKLMQEWDTLREEKKAALEEGDNIHAPSAP